MQRFRQILHATKCDKLSVTSWERAPSTNGGGMIPVDRLAQRIERLGYRVHLEPVATTAA